MPPKKDSKKGPKIGPLFEPQKADPTQTLGSSANNPADDGQPNTSNSGQVDRDNVVTTTADFENPFGGLPPRRPRSPTEPGQIREQTTEEDDSQTSSLGNTIRSSPLAAAADHKRENALLGNKPPELVAQQGNDTGKSPELGGKLGYPILVDESTSVRTPEKRTQTLIQLLESQENEAQSILEKSIKELRESQNDLLKKRFQTLRDWVNESSVEEETAKPSGEVEIPNTEALSVKAEEAENDIYENINLETSAKPSTRHVYPNGKTFDEMVNDPRFVKIPGSNRYIGKPLRWEDRVIGQVLRVHALRAGSSVNQCIWYDQNIAFDTEGKPHEREYPPDEKLRTAQGDRDPGDDSDGSSSDNSFDGYNPSKDDRRSKTPWLQSDSEESVHAEFSDTPSEKARLESQRKREKKKRRKAKKAREMLDILTNRGHDEYNRRIQQQLLEGIRRQLDQVLPSLEGIKNVKIKYPDPWAGDGNIDTFETWDNSVINWMVVNQLTGPEGNGMQSPGYVED
ncbi:hypothetical protein FB446DRAFT_788209 [Lentinula raphanica]|nr:hypothetical protein FB446DRAFT_788209 [Lentinula raphanica]